MQIVNYDTDRHDAILGANPNLWWGTDENPDGDASPWTEAPVGSIYVYVDTTNNEAKAYMKRDSQDSDQDWGAVGGVGVLQQTFSYTDFTDGGSTAGTLVLNNGIPKGAFVTQSVLVNVTGFTGDTSATIQVGDGTDVDRYSTGTPSVFTTAGAIDLGAVSGTEEHAAAISTVTLTITSATDWGAVTAGQATIRIFYYL